MTASGLAACALCDKSEKLPPIKIASGNPASYNGALTLYTPYKEHQTALTNNWHIDDLPNGRDDDIFSRMASVLVEQHQMIRVHSAEMEATRDFRLETDVFKALREVSEELASSGVPGFELMASKNAPVVQEAPDSAEELLTGKSKRGGASTTARKKPAFGVQEQPQGLLEPGEPHWHAIVKNTKFDMFFGFLIVLNSLTMSLNYQHRGYIIAGHLGITEQREEFWPGAVLAFEIMEHIFCSLFVIELVMRVFVFKKAYFRVAANWLDITIVMLTVLDLWIFSVLNFSAVNLTFLRVLRVARLVRMIRVVRVMRMFHELRVLVNTMQNAAGALFWSLCLLTVIMVIATIFVVQLLTDYITDDSLSHEMRVFIYTHFGSFSRGMLTMFEITVPGLGGWGAVVHIIIDEVQPLYGFFFTFYVAIVCFATLKVISALFIKETLTIANRDHEAVMEERIRQKTQIIENLRQVFKDVDRSGDGRVNFEEFKLIMDEPRVHAWLANLELAVDDLDNMFQLLDNGDGFISCDEFLQGIFRMKGGAKSMDVVTLIYETQKITRIIREIGETLE